MGMARLVYEGIIMGTTFAVFITVLWALPEGHIHPLLRDFRTMCRKLTHVGLLMSVSQRDSTREAIGIYG
jgi:hypothetical protein